MTKCCRFKRKIDYWNKKDMLAIFSPRSIWLPLMHCHLVRKCLGILYQWHSAQFSWQKEAALSWTSMGILFTSYEQFCMSKWSERHRINLWREAWTPCSLILLTRCELLRLLTFRNIEIQDKGAVVSDSWRNSRCCESNLGRPDIWRLIICLSQLDGTSWLSNWTLGRILH
jgi:hypothetical protein